MNKFIVIDRSNNNKPVAGPYVSWLLIRHLANKLNSEHGTTDRYQIANEE